MKTTKGKSEHFGPLRSPMAKAMHGPTKSSGTHVTGCKINLYPKIDDNTIRTDIKTGAARVRSAHTGGKVVKPW
jgi:hypothetical protein